jgi:hypothetical protein
MNFTRQTTIAIVAAFLLGVAFGGASLHYAYAQGMLGLTTSVKQIGGALVEMQKNIDDLQKNMGTLKQAKDQLTSLSSVGGGSIQGEGESLKKMIPGFGQ